MLQNELAKNISEDANTQKVHIYTYPDHIPSLSLNRLSTADEVVSIYEEYKNKKSSQPVLSFPASNREVRPKNKSIRLSGVHSIDRSQSSTKNIKRIKHT